ncbi:MAG TPA: TIGR02281 family clan AA aspartic protease, partial [Candidatus Poseidoniales archaeon]|nr:TIGR02281 family clan AA aspartic protease [Candidatus Poseidoniales archaeon]
MADDGRWWKKDEDTDTSKKDVEEMLNEAETKRIQREEELAEAEHREKMAEFSKTESQESDDGPTVEFDSQRIVLKPDRHGNFKCKGSIGNIANLDFLVDTGASFCSVKDETAKMLDLNWGEKVETETATGKGMGFRTTLPDVTIGQISIKNVDALINPLSESGYEILGMSFLKQIEWEHDDGVLILNPDGESVGGGGTDHWLLEDPGYTVAAIVLALGLIATAFMGVATAGSSDEWAETEAEVLEYYPGYDWVEHEDTWGDYYWELDCWADLDVSYSVDNTSYSAEVNHVPIRTYDDYEGVEDDCLDNMEDEHDGVVMLYYNIEDPSEVRIDSPGFPATFLLFFCGFIQLILLIVVLLLARLDVAGPNVNSSSGGRYYDDPGYYDRPWHRRPWFYHRRHHYHHGHRSHHRS